MAKAKPRKGAARRSRTAAKTTRPGGRKSARKPTRKAARKTAGRKAAAKSPAKRATGGTRARKGAAGTRKAGASRARTTKPRRGRTKPSTHTGTGAGVSRSPYLERERRRLPELEEGIPTPPSSLDLDRSASAVRTGRAELTEALHEHTETSPALTGGDVDADWENAASSGEEAPGGDNPTPDQQRVDDIGHALGVEYQDNEELRSVEKLDQRDKHRWELDPASAEDYRERQK